MGPPRPAAIGRWRLQVKGRIVRCRVATLDDLPALAALRWAFRAEDGEVPIDDEGAFAARYESFVRDGMRSGQWTHWVAETEQSTIVAQMAVCIVRSIPRPSRSGDQWGYLTDCYTDPAHRNEGVGRQLLAHVVSWARSNDLEMLIVWPSERSQSLYSRAGFAADADVRTLHLRDFDAAVTDA